MKREPPRYGCLRAKNFRGVSRLHRHCGVDSAGALNELGIRQSVGLGFIALLVRENQIVVVFTAGAAGDHVIESGGMGASKISAQTHLIAAVKALAVLCAVKEHSQ